MREREAAASGDPRRALGGAAARARLPCTMLIEDVDALKSWLAKLLEPM